MSEFKFFKERADRWGDSMRALWGSLGICPPTDHIGLPHHTMGELHSIGCLKAWGDAQKLHLGMAYLLVLVDDTSEAGNYGMAIVWIDSHQARMVAMGEALETLSSLTPKGSDWPYILIQLYEGANHSPLPKDRHVCVLPQGEAESPSGQVSQLKICQLLSTRPLVVFPVELNGGDQLVTIDLLESLHMGSSVITDEYPYIEVNIPTLVPEEQGNANSSLGGTHDTATANQPKTPWKPRFTLRGEVNDLIDRGMTDNYDQESEHSVMVEVPSTEVDTSPPLKLEKPVLLLDACSQASAAEMEASMESNPVGTLPMAATHSSRSSSPITHLSKLQSDVHLSINSMFTARRSSDLEIQWAIQDFKASLHQRGAETAAANEKAKVAHSRRDLKARVKCARAMMKAKYEYCMAVQEARAERCTELEESEATYSKALSRNTATLSLQCTMLCQEHMEHMQELEACTLRAENKSCQDFLIAHQVVLHQAPQMLKDDLHSSYSLLLGPSSSSHQSLMLAPASQAEGQPLSTIPLKLEPKQSLPLKRQHSSTEAQGYTSKDEDFPISSQEESSNPKKGKTANWLTCMKSDHADAFSWDSNSVKEARARYFTTHSWDWAHGNMEDLSDIFKELTQEAGLLWVYFQNTMVMEGTRAFTASQLHFSVSTQGTQIPKGSFHQGISKGHGPKGDSWPWGPPAFLQIHILPVVWKIRTEWGDHRKSPENYTL